ncbi:MAG TPA: cupin domain-containing protein [Crenalkalicoccus sp.]|jgi:quercetin dioxygenase-like cupin family protein|nr:cupin domain-containing protein [Crenalkalicoccus sp.]
MSQAHEPSAPRTTLHLAAAAEFEHGLRPFFAYRDLGLKQATGGGFGAHVIRAVPGRQVEPHWHAHDLAFQLVYVLRGWVRFEYADVGEVLLQAGDAVYQPPRVCHRELEHSDDLELIEITSPAEFATAPADPPAR